MPKNVDVKAIPDEEFIAYALRTGQWERYTHPQKGETLTLQIGDFPILSIHEALIDRAYPIGDFLRNLGDKEVSIALVAQLAKLQQQVDTLTRLVAAQLPDLD